ncbi:MAG: metallophosphoesterase [Anaerolineales bacterium]
MRNGSKAVLAVFLTAAGCAAPVVLPTAIPITSTSTATVPLLTTIESTAQPEATTEPGVDLLPELAPVEYVIPPTIQHAWPGGATVYFELAQEADVSILIAEDGLGPWRVALRAGAGQHFLLPLEDLVAGETYAIAVGVADVEGAFHAPSFLGEGWGPLRLHVPEESPSSVRLVALGDSGYGDPLTLELAAAAAAFAPDATLHLGDLVYRGEEEGTAAAAYARKFYHALEPLLVSGPIYPVLGNHELDGPVSRDGAPYYFSAFPTLPEWCCGDEGSTGSREWYRVVFGTWQFLFLNSQAFYGYGDGEAQNAWLERRLGDAEFFATVPVMHIAPFSGGLHTTDGGPLRSVWHPRFVAADVPLVLAGHDHNYERFLVDGVSYVVSGGGSRVLYAKEEELPGEVIFAARNHFLLLDLGPDGFQVQAITELGEVIDQYTWP